MANPEGVSVFSWLLSLCDVSIGPRGKGVAIASGVVHITSDSVEALRQVVQSMKIDESAVEVSDTVATRLLYSQHPFTKLIVQAVSAHRESNGDGGWCMLSIIASMCERLAASPTQHCLPPAILKTGHHLLQGWIRHFFYCKLLSGLTVQGDRGVHLVALVSSLLQTNGVLALSSSESLKIASKVLRLYLHGTQKGAKNYRFLSVSAPLSHSLQCDLKEGVFLKWGVPLEYDEKVLRMGVEWKGSCVALRKAEGTMKVVVFDVCVEPENDKNFRDVLTQNPKDDIRVVSDGTHDSETRNLKRLMQCIVSHGVDIVLCQKTVHEACKVYLSAHGVLCLDRLSNRHINEIVYTTGASVVSSLSPDSLCEGCFGAVTLLEEVYAGAIVGAQETAEKYLRVVGVRSFQTFVVQHAFRHIAMEAERMCARSVKYVARFAGESEAVSMSRSVLPGCGVWQAQLALFLQSILQVSHLATLGALQKIAHSAAFEKVRDVVTAFASALLGCAKRLDPSSGATLAAQKHRFGEYYKREALCVVGADPLRAKRLVGVVHGCDAPRGAVFCALRTVVGGGDGGGVDAEGCVPARSFEAVRANRGARKATPSQGGAPLSEICRFDEAGVLVLDETRPDDFPILDSAEEKLRALLGALEVFQLLGRTDTMLLDLN